MNIAIFTAADKKFLAVVDKRCFLLNLIFMVDYYHKFPELGNLYSRGVISAISLCHFVTIERVCSIQSSHRAFFTRTQLSILFTIDPYVETRATYARKFTVWGWAEADARVALYLGALQRAWRLRLQVIQLFIWVKLENLGWISRNVSLTTR